MQRHQEYADGLVAKHGKDKAIKIVSRCLNTTGRDLTMFDEAEFTINDHGRYEYAKTQSNKVFGKKDKRIKANYNFFSLVLKLLNKGTKNAIKN